MFDVYVDGATGTSREAVRDLAGAMAARYRLPAAELEARLTRGRFRVKAGVDRATAEAYLRDLAAIGARVRIEPAGEPAGQPSQPESRPALSSLPPQSQSRTAPSSLSAQTEPWATRSSLPPRPESRPAPSSLSAQTEPWAMRSSLPPQSQSRPVPSSLPAQTKPRARRSSLPPSTESRPVPSSLPPQAEPRAMRSSLPPQPEPRPAGASLPPSAGSPLAPALPVAGSSGSPGGGGVVTATGPMATLGALDRSGALSLATLDDEPAQSPATDGILPASMGPAAPRPARPARSRNEPVDPFAPPELAAEEPLLQLAGEDVAGVAKGDALASSAPAGVPRGLVTVRSGVPQRLPAAMPALPLAGTPRSSAAAEPATTTAFRRPGRALVARIPVLASARVRLVAGVALAIALGFVPAHLVGGMRERSAFGAIDARVVAVQSAADAPDSYAALDGFRAEQLDAKYSARRSIVVASLLVWAAAGAALAFGWFSLFRPAPAARRGTRAPFGG